MSPRALPKSVHFMGIGGSGMSGVAQIAAAQGFQVSGCDLSVDTPYISKVQNLGLPVSLGHDPLHLDGVDILAVTPAVFYQNNTHPEVELARSKGILMKWQEFMGQYLHLGKFVICIAGTHGKSTTTALAGQLLETAQLDPTVEVGATVPLWHSNVRIGTGRYFISEADEFHNNFASYRPDIIILNNIEMDHPEYFGSVDKLLSTYRDFISHLKPHGTLIYNSNSALAHSLVSSLSHPHFNLVPYSYFEIHSEHLSPTATTFSYHGHNYSLSLPGRHNIENALGVIELARLLKIKLSQVKSSLKSFTGIDRRLQFLGEKHGIKVYDDYANHPTAFLATIQAARQLHPGLPVWAVIEPHTFSRLRTLLPQLPASLASADQVIITKVFASRETDPGDFSGLTITDYLNRNSPPAKKATPTLSWATYIPEFPAVADHLKSQAPENCVILVMGSGLSHRLSRLILELL